MAIDPFIPPEPIEGELISSYHRRVTEELAAWATRTIDRAIARLDGQRQEISGNVELAIMGSRLDQPPPSKDPDPRPSVKPRRRSSSSWRDRGRRRDV